MLVPLYDFSSNNALETIAKFGYDPKNNFNNALMDRLGASASEMREALSTTEEEFLDGLPFQGERSEWEDAARHQYFLYHHADKLSATE